MNAQAIIGLLSESLSDDASEVLRLTTVDEDTVHEVLHRRIGAAGRALRSSRLGVPIHAAVCAMPAGGGVLASGHSGFGKSTLVTLLCLRRGATFVSDDTIWLEGVVARGFGAPLTVRPESPFAEMARALPYASGSGRLLVRPLDFGIAVAESSIVDILLFPAFGDAPACCRILTPTEAFARLVMSLLRPINEADVLTLAYLAASCRAAAIQYADSDSCLAVADQAFAINSSEVTSFELIHSEELAASGFQADIGGMRFDDAASIWNQRTGTVVCLDGWRRGETLARGEAFETLRTLGYISDTVAG